MNPASVSMFRGYIELKVEKGEVIDGEFKAKGIYMDIEISGAELAYQNGSGNVANCRSGFSLTRNMKGAPRGFKDPDT